MILKITRNCRRWFDNEAVKLPKILLGIAMLEKILSIVSELLFSLVNCSCSVWRRKQPIDNLIGCFSNQKITVCLYLNIWETWKIGIRKGTEKYHQELTAQLTRLYLLTKERLISNLVFTGTFSQP